MSATPREKMRRYVVALLMSFIIVATSRTEPIDSRALGSSDTIGEHNGNEMFPKSGGRSSVVTDQRLRSRPLIGHYHEATPEIGALDYIYDNKAFEDFDELTEAKSEPTTDSNELNVMSTFLSTLLRQPTWESPLAMVNEPGFLIETEQESQSKGSNNAELPRPNVSKRSRYYRRYPHKYQNARFHNAYDYDTAYFCMPSRNDIFHLLDALHDLRQGDDSARNIHFCNRRRTARALLNHVRFIGRRK